MGEARPFGRHYDDFEVGDVYKHWPGKTITEYDDHLFCMITMNHHPLHTNAHYATTSTPFGKRSTFLIPAIRRMARLSLLDTTHTRSTTRLCARS